MAYMVARDCNESIEYILWKMPIQQVFAIVGLVYQTHTGNQVSSYRERYLNKKLVDKIEDLTNE